jgi:hypothetical protein
MKHLPEDIMRISLHRINLWLIVNVAARSPEVGTSSRILFGTVILILQTDRLLSPKLEDKQCPLLLLCRMFHVTI